MWRNDSKAFLFSQKNPTNNPRKLRQIERRFYSVYSVDDVATIGPSFGFKDLRLISTRYTRRYSYEALGYTCTVPSSKRRDPFLTGNNRFMASEIETFYETTQ